MIGGCAPGGGNGGGGGRWTLPGPLTMPDCLIPAFVERTLRQGFQQISSGFPRAASHLWKEEASRLIREMAIADERRRCVNGCLEDCQNIGRELGLPALSAEGAEDLETLYALILGWRSDALDRKMTQLFWTTHHPFLTRMRNRAAPPLSPQRKRKLTQLINSANRMEPPGISEVLELCKAYADQCMELLSVLESDVQDR
jgi:hypothetical protein